MKKSLHVFSLCSCKSKSQSVVIGVITVDERVLHVYLGRMKQCRKPEICFLCSAAMHSPVFVHISDSDGVFVIVVYSHSELTAHR